MNRLLLRAMAAAVVAAIALIAACICLGYFSLSAARADSTPAPMTMGTAQSSQTTQDLESQPATPVSAKEWSVFNHRAAGFFLLLWGLTALIAGLQWPRRTWVRFVPPLMLFGLVEFLILLIDPKAWPNGPYGFWISFADPSVVQHRVFVLLLLLLGTIELLRAADRLPSLLRVFAVPSLAVFGAIYLFFHKHGGLEAQQMMQHVSGNGLQPGHAKHACHHEVGQAAASLVLRPGLRICGC
ncbi:MAG TPA: hypothetical protein VN934_12550 [Candidatus Tumulicola sp.]|nr:hypothetical protein [Candidatus Tumulicola sp.]